MAATLNISESKLSTSRDFQSWQSNRLFVAVIISLLLHLIVLLGVNFKMPSADFDKMASSLEVVLVNNKTIEKPNDTKLLAQDNLDGGGNTDNDRRAKTNLPVLPPSKPLVSGLAVQQKVEQLELEAKRLMTSVESDKIIHQPETPTNQTEQKQMASATSDLQQRSLDIARLQAQISKDVDNYQKRPIRKFIGARTKEYRFARYVEDWRLKIERIGNMNYPEEARRGKLYGSLQLTVGIRADGSLESIGINRSSGEKVLDEAAIRIVRLSGQNGFAPFPPEISRDTDILHITRTWAFARSDKLISQ